LVEQKRLSESLLIGGGKLPSHCFVPHIKE
jgi:hypothetical protein